MYHEIRKEFYKDVDGLVLVCNITDKLSFQKLSTYLTEFRAMNSSPNIPTVIAFSQADTLSSNASPSIKQEEIDEFVGIVGQPCFCFVVSASDGSQVRQMFLKLFETCLAK